MFLTIKQQVKHLSREDYLIIKNLSHIAKNLANQAIYNIRQHYFKTGKYLSYGNNYNMLKCSENYKMLNSNMAQQILMEVDDTFKSFFALKKLAKEGKYSKKINIPRYLPKDGFTTLIIGQIRLNKELLIPYSQSFSRENKRIKIKVPSILLDKEVKEIKIIPRSDARFFEIHYSYKVEVEERNLNKNNALAIDLGINNLATCVTSFGKSFIVDGKRLKSINQWYNKENARLQSIKDMQGHTNRFTNRQKINAEKRNNRVNDYISKTARIIINYCLDNDIGKIVCGYDESFQKYCNIGKVNNQKFVNIPYGKLIQKLSYLCELYEVDFVIQEESYTSKASFFDKDSIPIYDKNNPQDYTFSGKRIKRGLYKTKTGKTLNADVNAALNILSKSKVVDLRVLYCRGVLDTPARIKIA